MVFIWREAVRKTIMPLKRNLSFVFSLILARQFLTLLYNDYRECSDSRKVEKWGGSTALVPMRWAGYCFGGQLHPFDGKKVICYVVAVWFFNVYMHVSVSFIRTHRVYFRLWVTGQGQITQKQKPKIDKSYQFGNGHCTSENNAVARWESRLTLIMRLVCQGTWRTGSPGYLCLHG